jgi:NAD(P)-dependent dehydrogenase (short-subunit alcohol dehydrogenase family)
VNVEGRVVAVTGAGSGIGAAIAREAARRGAAAVAIIDIDEAAAQGISHEISMSGTPAAAYRCDIAEPGEVEQTAFEVTSDLGTPGLVCANAGIFTDPAPLLTETPQNLNWALSVNVVGAWATLRSFGNRMRESNSPGWLLVTASEHSLGAPHPGSGAYTISKHAVLGLADVFRSELPAHIGISVLIPGLVATGLSRSGIHRPAVFGGPTSESENSRLVLAHGMDPAVVAGAALDGVQADSFLIATHSHVFKNWQRRCLDVERAFDRLAHSDIPDKSYEVMEVVARLRNAAPQED